MITNAQKILRSASVLSTSEFTEYKMSTDPITQGGVLLSRVQNVYHGYCSIDCPGRRNTEAKNRLE